MRSSPSWRRVLLELSRDRVLLKKLGRGGAGASVGVRFSKVVTQLHPGQCTRHAQMSMPQHAQTLQFAETFRAGALEAIAGAASRQLARRICQALVLLPLFSLILLPEYVQGLGDPRDEVMLCTPMTVGRCGWSMSCCSVLIAAHGVAWASSRRLCGERSAENWCRRVWDLWRQSHSP